MKEILIAVAVIAGSWMLFQAIFEARMTYFGYEFAKYERWKVFPVLVLAFVLGYLLGGM